MFMPRAIYRARENLSVFLLRQKHAFFYSADFCTRALQLLRRDVVEVEWRRGILRFFICFYNFFGSAAFQKRKIKKFNVYCAQKLKNGELKSFCKKS